MAKKSTTKAKPKTRITKTAAAKAVRSTKTATKVVTAKVAQPDRVESNVTGLRKILAASAALYILLAAVAGTYMLPKAYQLTAGYLTRDELASETSTVFAPATRVMYDVEIRWVLVALLLASAVLPVLYLTRLQRAYSERLKGRVMAWRWIDFAVTGALMVEITALLSGIQDLATLKLAGGLIALAAVFSWLAERQNADAVERSWGAFNASLASLGLAGLAVALYGVSTPLYGILRSPWYVYALYGVLVTSFVLFAINQAYQHRRFRGWKNYVTAERNHLVIGMLSKVAFAIILIIGLYNKG